jgi:hypothetical protein
MLYGTKDNISYGFFCDNEKELLKSYTKITDVEWKSLLNGQSGGKEIKPDDNGKPILTEYVETLAEKQTDVQEKVGNLIDAVFWRIERYESQSKLGVDTTDSADNYKAVLQYVQDLREVNHQNAYATDPNNVIWPILEV